MKKISIVSFILLFLTSGPLFAGSISLEELNGDSWVIRTSGGNGTFETNYDLDTLPDSFTVLNPQRHEKAWKWTGSGVEYDTTGTNVKPSPSESKAKLLTKADTDWNWSDSKIRTLRTDYALMFDYIEAKKYKKAKGEATYAYNQNDITEAERDWIHDLLDGKK